MIIYLAGKTCIAFSVEPFLSLTLEKFTSLEVTIASFVNAMNHNILA